MDHNATLLLCVLLSVVLLIVLIAVCKLHAFVALTMASITMGLLSGMKPLDVAKSFQEGVGAVLASIAVVVGLGTILGKLLAESRGAETIANTLRHWLGDSKAHWTIFIVALLVGIPTFFAVGLVLVVPILFTMLKQTGRPLLSLGIPVLAALSTMHGLVPPHPGPIAVIDELHADIGKTLVYSLLVGIPTAVLAGPILGRVIASRVSVPLSGALAAQLTTESAVAPPNFGASLFTILSPVLLMLAAAVARLTLPAESFALSVAEFFGHPAVALLIAVLIALYTFGFARGFTREQLLRFANDCLGPVATILLIVGAGGGFNRVLNDCGAGRAIIGIVRHWPVSPLILGWLVAAAIRVAAGSATVAIKMAGGIMAPLALADRSISPELLVLALGAGSSLLSHVNDGGFWIVKEYFNMSVAQTLKTWTVMISAISVIALLLVLLLNAVLSR
ncbi:MAG TPA: gluconate:H+ symporter [Verrucomicrobiae bacterium]|nr:gluconate:H+ symporter [Verrucomicrobiae bacterium]